MIFLLVNTFYNVPYCHEIALMPIQPKYTEKIAKGEKKSRLERRYLLQL